MKRSSQITNFFVPKPKVNRTENDSSAVDINSNQEIEKVKCLET